MKTLYLRTGRVTSESSCCKCNLFSVSLRRNVLAVSVESIISSSV